MARTNLSLNTQKALLLKVVTDNYSSADTPKNGTLRAGNQKNDKQAQTALALKSDGNLNMDADHNR